MDAADFVVKPGQGLLLVYEGISGSGKSEDIRRLLRSLEEEGVPAYLAEWNSNPFLRRLAARLERLGWLTAGVYSLLQWIGFYADYRLRIAPRLRAGEIVIADRYVHTGLARDAVNGARPRWVRRWPAGVRVPDLVFFCDTPPLICYHRIQSRGKELFYPGKRKTTAAGIGMEGDLFYLQRMRDEYVRILAAEAAAGRANVIHLRDGEPDACATVAAYRAAKSGASPRLQPQVQTQGQAQAQAQAHAQAADHLTRGM